MMEQQHLQLQLLIKQLERELDEVKSERENLGNIVEKQLSQLQSSIEEKFTAIIPKVRTITS